MPWVTSESKETGLGCSPRPHSTQVIRYRPERIAIRARGPPATTVQIQVATQVNLPVIAFDLTPLRSHHLGPQLRMIKKFCLTALFVFSALVIISAQESSFRGLEKAMDSETYERAGLSKLTAEERTVLDDFIRGYVAGKQKAAASAAATEAVDRAVKEKKVQAPDFIESTMVGAYKGYGPRTFFTLENGQVWRPTQGDVVNVSPIQNPKVIITRDTFGYKMFVEGAGSIRVKRER